MSSILISATSGTTNSPLDFRVIFNQPIIIPKYAQVQLVGLRLWFDFRWVSSMTAKTEDEYIANSGMLLECKEFGNSTSHCANNTFGTPSFSIKTKSIKKVGSQKS